MGMQRAWIATSLLAACGPATKSADKPGNVASVRPLCIDPVSPGGIQVDAPTAGVDEQPWMVSGNDALPALEAGWNLMALIEDGGAQFAVVITDGCDLGHCDPHLLRVEHDTITARVPLPFTEAIWEGGDYPFVVYSMARQGDDLWIGYDLVGEPEPAVGSTTRYYLAAFAPADLTTRWTGEVSSYPEAESLEACDSEVVAVDADCDGASDLVQTMTCRPAECLVGLDDEDAEVPEGCAGQQSVTRSVFIRNAAGVYAAREGG